ncbi:MAG: hypothetical protein JW941_07420 [Candidatus Coatesbacteria bacterium]|nr:hypothetical protein [Candidatus Coatesbacteria bacterium]
MAVCFTVAFVTFQVVSSRLTSGAAAIILRSPALQKILSTGVSTIFFSLAFLVIIPKSGTWLTGLAISAAIVGVLAGGYILFLALSFFAFALDYVRQEVILEMHSGLLKEMEEQLEHGKCLEALPLHLKDELHVLAELWVEHCGKNDQRARDLLLKMFSQGYLRAFEILRDGPREGDIFATRLKALYAYIDELIGALDELDFHCSGHENRGKIWLSPLLSVLRSGGKRCLEFPTPAPLSTWLGRLSQFYLRAEALNREAALSEWGRMIYISIGNLHSQALYHMPNGVKSEAWFQDGVFARQLLGNLFYYLNEALHACVREGYTGLCRGILTNQMNPSLDGVTFLRHTKPYSDDRIISLIRFERKMLWRTILNVGGHVAYRDYQPNSDMGRLLEFLSLATCIFRGIGNVDLDEQGFLEIALLDALKSQDHHRWVQGNYSGPSLQDINIPRFWILLRIILGACGIWSENNMICEGVVHDWPTLKLDLQGFLREAIRWAHQDQVLLGFRDKLASRRLIPNSHSFHRSSDMLKARFEELTRTN